MAFFQIINIDPSNIGVVTINTDDISSVFKRDKDVEECYVEMKSGKRYYMTDLSYKRLCDKLLEI